MCLAFIFEDMSFVGGNTIIFIHIYKKINGAFNIAFQAVVKSAK